MKSNYRYGEDVAHVHLSTDRLDHGGQQRVVTD